MLLFSNIFHFDLNFNKISRKRETILIITKEHMHNVYCLVFAFTSVSIICLYFCWQHPDSTGYTILVEHRQRTQKWKRRFTVKSRLYTFRDTHRYVCIQKHIRTYKQRYMTHTYRYVSIHQPHHTIRGTYREGSMTLKSVFYTLPDTHRERAFHGERMILQRRVHDAHLSVHFYT